MDGRQALKHTDRTDTDEEEKKKKRKMNLTQQNTNHLSPSTENQLLYSSHKSKRSILFFLYIFWRVHIQHHHLSLSHTIFLSLTYTQSKSKSKSKYINIEFYDRRIIYYYIWIKAPTYEEFEKDSNVKRVEFVF